MVGVVSWIAAGVAASLLARLLPPRRCPLGIELAVAVVAALLAGFAATALDFGGLAVIDARAIGFAMLAAAAAVAAVRLNRP